MKETERIALLHELEQKSRRSERRARWVGWGTVGAAAVVLLILLVTGGVRLEELQRRIAVEKASLQALAEEREQRQLELRATEKRLEDLREVVGKIDRTQVEAAYEQKARSSASSAQQAPRVYVHIAQQADRAYAQEVVHELEKQGFVVPGIEYVESAQRLPDSQVRYFKQSDRAQADRLERVLQDRGMGDAKTTYLRRYEDDASVRGNQYELWIKPQQSAQAPRR